MVIAFKRNTLIVLIRQLNMVETSLAVLLGESIMLKQTNSLKEVFVLTKDFGTDIVYNLIYAVAYTKH